MITSFFSKKTSESENFEQKIYPKRISFAFDKKPFELVLNTFDENIQKGVLMIYVHQIVNQNNLNSHLIKSIFNCRELAAFANNNFQFYPILGSQKSLSKVGRFFAPREVPCLLFLRWGLERGLSCMGIQPLKGSSTPDSVREAMNDVLERVDDEKRKERDIEGEIDRKEATRVIAEREQQRQRDQLMSGGNAAPNTNALNRFVLYKYIMLNWYP